VTVEMGGEAGGAHTGDGPTKGWFNGGEEPLASPRFLLSFTNPKGGQLLASAGLQPR